jgi:hypothetical protein
MKSIITKAKQPTAEDSATMLDFEAIYKMFTDRFDPAPHRRTIQAWLRKAGVRTTSPRKRDPRRGGGKRWYLRSDVNRMFGNFVN